MTLEHEHEWVTASAEAVQTSGTTDGTMWVGVDHTRLRVVVVCPSCARFRSFEATRMPDDAP